MHPTCFSPTIRAPELKPLAWKCPGDMFALRHSPLPHLRAFYCRYLLKTREMCKTDSFCKEKTFYGLWAGESETRATSMKNHCPPTPRGDTYCPGHMSLIYTLDGKLSQLLIFLKHLEIKQLSTSSPGPSVPLPLHG